MQTGTRSGFFRLQTFSALRNADYRYLWISSVFISAGNQVQQIAMGWLLVSELDQSPFWVGTVLGMRALPILFVGPLAGVLIDRFDRKTLFLAAQLVLVVTAFLFALDVQAGTVTVAHALIFTLILGLDSAINQPVRQALIVNTVPREDVTNAIALNNSANSIMQSVAPLISGTLILALGVGGNFFVQGVAYLAVFCIILPMKTPYREGTSEWTSVRSNFMEGIRFIKGDTTLLLLIVLVFIPSLFIHSTQNLFSVYAVTVLVGGPLVFSLMGASMGIGAVLATIAVASLGNYQARGRVNMASITLVTAFLAAFALSSHIALTMVVLGALGFLNTSFRLANNALVHSRTPDELRGRVTSIYVMDHGFQPLGSPLLGFLAGSAALDENFLPGSGLQGVQKAVLLAGIVALAVTVFIGLRFRRLWRLA